MAGRLEMTASEPLVLQRSRDTIAAIERNCITWVIQLIAYICFLRTNSVLSVNVEGRYSAVRLMLSQFGGERQWLGRIQHGDSCEAGSG